jgi:urea carboxylase-associated protein 2
MVHRKTAETSGQTAGIDMDHMTGSEVTDTGTLSGARDHARSLARAAVADRVVPVTAAVLPADASGAVPLWAETIRSGSYAARRLLRESIVRIEDVEGDACIQLLLHSAIQPAERLNAADTVKVQWQAYLGAGSLLLSDMGRVLMTIVGDTSQRHDCLCGASTRHGNDERYGDGGVAGAHPSGRDLLALGVAKLGGSRRDVAPSLNLFKSAHTDVTGALHLDGEPRPGTYVDLRAEMDVWFTIANTPHPLDERPAYTGTAVRCRAWIPVPIDTAADPLRTATPERQRAFENTDDFLTSTHS